MNQSGDITDTHCVGGQSHKVFGDSRFLWKRRQFIIMFIQ